MRRLYKILAVLFVIFLALLILYAAPPTRPWMEHTLGPPLNMAFSTVWTSITASAPYQFIIANPLWILILGLILGIVPVSFPILHGAFNFVRGKAVISAAKETGMYPQQTRPKTTPISTPAPQPTKTESTPTPQPQPAETKTEPAPTPEPEAAE